MGHKPARGIRLLLIPAGIKIDPYGNGMPAGILLISRAAAPPTPRAYWVMLERFQPDWNSLADNIATKYKALERADRFQSVQHRRTRPTMDETDL